MPLSTSLTMVCAARPMATPATPAEASSGARLTPTADRKTMLTMHQDDGNAGGADHAGQGFNLGKANLTDGMALRNASHAAGDESAGSHEHEGDDGDHDQVRQPGAHEFLGVVYPLVEHLSHEPAFGEESGSHSGKNQTVHLSLPFFLYPYCAEARGAVRNRTVSLFLSGRNSKILG